MALFRFALSSISRSAGRSAVAAAAYRSGEKLRDTRAGKNHDYSRKERPLFTGLIGWNGTRAELWNSAEEAENRKNSVVAREIQLGLPPELTARQRQKLTLDFAAALRNRYGVAVDISIHPPSKRGDQRNHHAHILLTTRAVEAEKFGAKTRILDVKTTSRTEVENLRAEWADRVNSALAKAGKAVRVDPRSLVRQGKKRESEHLHRGALELERRGETTDKGDELRKRRRRNRLAGIAEKISRPGVAPQVIPNFQPVPTIEPETPPARSSSLAAMKSRALAAICPVEAPKPETLALAPARGFGASRRPPAPKTDPPISQRR